MLSTSLPLIVHLVSRWSIEDSEFCLWNSRNNCLSCLNQTDPETLTFSTWVMPQWTAAGALQRLLSIFSWHRTLNPLRTPSNKHDMMRSCSECHFSHYLSLLCSMFFLCTNHINFAWADCHCRWVCTDSHPYTSPTWLNTALYMCAQLKVEATVNYRSQ